MPAPPLSAMGRTATIWAIHLAMVSLGAAQLANFADLLRLASIPSNTNSDSRSDRSLANSYPFNLGERQAPVQRNCGVLGWAQLGGGHQQQHQHQAAPASSF